MTRVWGEEGRAERGGNARGAGSVSAGGPWAEEVLDNIEQCGLSPSCLKGRTGWESAGGVQGTGPWGA